MYTGTIASVVVDRGFGFVRPSTNDIYSGDLFFHCSDLTPPLVFSEQLKQLSVSFDIDETPRGFRARNVRGRD